MSDSVTAVAVVIATRDRPHLLFERALFSVTAQTRPPEFIVLVDDSSPYVRATNQGMVEALRLPGCRVVYLKNGRTEGASGSWNTALEFLLAEVELPDRLFVAILDDDDAWRPTYLERCMATARADRLDMVAADLRRIESADGHDAIEEAPEVFERTTAWSAIQGFRVPTSSLDSVCFWPLVGSTKRSGVRPTATSAFGSPISAEFDTGACRSHWSNTSPSPIERVSAHAARRPSSMACPRSGESTPGA